MDLALGSNSRLFQSIRQRQHYTCGLTTEESREQIEELCSVSSNFESQQAFGKDLTSKFEAARTRWKLLKQQGLRYASKKLEEANEKITSIRTVNKYADALDYLNSKKNPFQTCMFPAQNPKPPTTQSFASGESGSSERCLYVPPVPPKLLSYDWKHCEFAKRIDELEIPRKAFINSIEKLIVECTVHPTAQQLCRKWKTDRGLDSKEGELLLYLVFGRAYEWNLESILMDVEVAMRSHAKVQEAIQSQLERTSISYDAYDLLEREIWTFCENTVAPRKALDLVYQMKPVLEQTGVSIEDLCNVFGPPKHLVQVGPHQAILDFYQGKTFVEDFMPLDEKSEWPTVGDHLGDSHWGPVRDLGDFNGGVIVKVIKRNKYERRANGLDKWNDDPASEVAMHRYLTSIGHPNLVRFEAVTMDNLNVYYYQERGVELFSTVKRHRERFWDQWKKTLEDKPDGYHLDNKSPWEQRMCKVFYGIFQGVAFLHQNRIAHRDLKLENMVAVHSEGQLVGKLIDFGVALQYGEWESDMRNHGKVGTYPFMSPEMCYNMRAMKAAKAEIVISDYQTYDAALNDAWTLGHALWGYAMGVLLWNDIASTDVRFTIATRAKFSSNPSPWRFKQIGLRYLAKRYGKSRTSMCTENLIDLMERLLCPEEERWTMEACLEHPWFDDIRF